VSGGSRLGNRPKVLSVAGSDSGGGAGIQADLKTFQELGVFGMAAVTAVTAQNSVGVHGVFPLDGAAVKAQLDAVLSDIGADAVKTGMLPSAEAASAVADAVETYGIGTLVVDPVMLSKHGHALADAAAAEVLRSRLLPLARVVTPNIPEACALLGWPESRINAESDMAEAAHALVALGASCVLLKGGHLPVRGEDGPGRVTDVLADRSGTTFLRGPRTATPHTHGTGCTLASALAALLALGFGVKEAAAAAKKFTAAAIAAGGPTGRGTGALWHAAARRPAVPRDDVAFGSTLLYEQESGFFER